MRVALITLVALLHAPTGSAQLSIEDARTLPLRDLATRLLGASGEIMIDVDRPDPDYLASIRFYGHSIAWGSYYPVCAADFVTVEFDEKGRIDSLQSERRFGVEGDLYRKGWTYEEFGQMCSKVATTRHYFPAPDHHSAWIIANYLDAIAKSGPSSKQNFTYTCSGVCAGRDKDLRELVLVNISSVANIECGNLRLKLPSCYEITVEAGLLSEVFRVYGTFYMNKVVLSRITKWGTIAVP